VTPEGEDYRIEMAGSTLKEEPLPVGRAEPLAGPLVLVVSADVMGRGNEELGHILIRSFFPHPRRSRARGQTGSSCSTPVCGWHARGRRYSTTCAHWRQMGRDPGLRHLPGLFRTEREAGGRSGVQYVRTSPRLSCVPARW